ncbi:MAG: hypothetical protein JSU09_09195 [Bacteroidetes bacterium]|nr:hypothetical protein [Bacteroidota bacterium]
MLRFYTPVLILQAVTLYLACRNNAEQRWYWFIIFFPGLGSILYLFDQYYSRKNLNSLTETIKEVVNSNHKTEQLEKALRFSDNTKNKLNLADAYMEIGRYADAINLYQSTLTGFMEDDPGVRMKLLDAQFRTKTYDQVIVLGEKLESEKIFKNAEQRFLYAWALHYQGKSEAADKIFQDLNKPFANFKHRVEYGAFLAACSKKQEAKALLEGLLEEFEHMSGPERKLHRDVNRGARNLYASLSHQQV